MTLTLLGDVFLGIFLTMIADRVGRRKILFAGSALMIVSGLVFAYFENFWILLIAAIVGEYPRRHFGDATILTLPRRCQHDWRRFWSIPSH